MKNFAVTALVLCATSLAAAAGIDGKWTSEMEVGDADGGTYAHVSTFVLKNDGGSLTGTVVQTSKAPWMNDLNGRSFDIRDGKVDGNKFSFKLTLQRKTGDRTAVYEGTVEGDYLKGIIKYRGIGQTRPFDAKRAN